MGGGGTSGAVQFPAYMENTHKQWLDADGITSYVFPSIPAVMKTMLADNPSPYESKTYEDINYAILPAISEELGEFDLAVDNFSATDTYQTITDSVVAQVDKEGVLNNIDTATLAEAIKSESKEVLTEAIAFATEQIDSGYLEDIFHAYIRRSNYAKSRAIRSFASGMADINAVQSSAFLFGVALIESEHLQQVDEFNRTLTKENYDKMVSEFMNSYKQRLGQELQVKLQEATTRTQFLSTAVQMTLQRYDRAIEWKQAVSQLTGELMRLRFVMDSESTANNADLDAKNAMWDMEVYKQGVALLGGIGGGHPLPEGPSKAGSAIGGALSGAASGAMAGSVIPGIGTAVGAGIGGVMGLASGLMN